MDAWDKLFAEAGLAEIKMILGWEFDFRHPKISLPKNKFIAWTTHVNQLLVAGLTTAKELKSTIGRLGHLALVVPGVYHFLTPQPSQQTPTFSHASPCNPHQQHLQK